VIIDDREDVWQHAPNMINVKPYRYFKQTGDINAPSKSSKLDHTDRTQSSLSKPDHPDRVPPPSDANNQPDDDHDDYLIHAEDILQRVHRAFYELYDRDRTRLPDLKSVIPYVKGKVLRGVHIVFSGLIANNQSAESTPIYRAAIAFGATVHPDVDRHSTTHVIAARWGTHKVHMAARYASGIHIVTPQWLWECVERWERVDEKLFALERQTIVSMPVEKCRSRDTFSIKMVTFFKAPPQKHQLLSMNVSVTVVNRQHCQRLPFEV
jgi:RNA polymerase II subunit A-like phosphatase